MKSVSKSSCGSSERFNMSTITFEIREDGRDYWTRYHSIELNTADYANYDDMAEAATQLVWGGESEGGEKDYGDSEERDEVEHEDDDYDADEEHEWADAEKPTVKPPEESAIEW